jgi:hypothetical protein
MGSATEGSKFESQFWIEFSPRHPDRFWGPPSLYPMGTEGSSLGGKAAGALS